MSLVHGQCKAAKGVVELIQGKIQKVSANKHHFDNDIKVEEFDWYCQFFYEQ